MRLPILFLTIAALQESDPPPYEGPLEKHPSFPLLRKVLEESVGAARKDLSKRLGEEVPELSFSLVALEEPLDEVRFPGTRPYSYSVRMERKKLQVLARLPVELYIRNPSRAREALVRILVQAHMTRGASFTIGATGGSHRDTFPVGPFFDAIGSHFAGALEEEIEFTLCQYLEHWRDISTAVAPLEEDKSRERPPEGKELTYPFLVRWLLARGRGEKALLEVVEGWQKGQPFLGALKRASGKELPLLNREIAKAYREYLDARLSAQQADAVRRVDDAFRGKKYEAALEGAERFLRDSPQSIATGNILFLKGKVLAQMQDPRAEEVLVHCLDRFGANRSFAPEAHYELALLLLRLGRKEEARIRFEALRDEFGWYEEARRWVEKHAKEYGG